MDAPDDGADRRSRLRDRFEATFGYWPTAFDLLLERDPDFVERYVDLYGHPWRDGPLDPKVKAFVCIAVNANTAQLSPEGTRQFVGLALDAGASVDEVVHVLEMSTAMACHGYIESVPHVVDVAGRPDPPDEAARAARDSAKETFRDRRGYWADFWELPLELDPAFLESYAKYSADAIEGPVDPKSRELVLAAIDVATTHLYEKGVRVHVERAVDAGATRAEVVEMIELTMMLGENTLRTGLPILAEEAAARGLLDRD